MPSVPNLPDSFDRQLARRPYPLTDFTIRPTHARTVAHLKDIQGWWIDLAKAYLNQVENGCTDATYDVKRCLASAALP